jgi:heptosyltransferase I
MGCEKSEWRCKMFFMRIAIVKLSALGDIVHSMIVLQFIKKYNKEIVIDWVVEETYKDLLEFHPDINQVHVINIRKAKKKKSFLLLLKELKKARNLGPYDSVIDMQGLIKSAIISKLIPANKTIGFDKDSIREKLASFFYSDKFNYGYSKNIIERNTALFEYTLNMSISKLQIQQKAPFLFPRSVKLNTKLSTFKKNIILIPGASHISKCYPPSKFAELTTLIDANFFVIWGNKEEKIMANKIKDLSNKVNVCGHLQLDSLMLLISKVDLVIGPDTGPTHIAWALNVPSITLFGPTPGRRNAYETSANRIIESDSKVNPMKINKGDLSIKNIDTGQISLVVSELLGH